MYDKIMKGVDNEERIEVRIPLDHFEQEAREFSSHNLTDFFKSKVFIKDFQIDGRHIKTVAKF